MEHGSRKGQWQLLVGLLIGVACLGAVFIFYARPGEILDHLKHANYGFVLIGALGIVAFLLLRAVRWRFMLDNDAPYDKVFHIQNIGYMLTQWLPFRLGDVARAVLIGSVPPVTIARGVSTMVIERLLDMLFVVVLLPFTLSGLTTLPDWMRSFALFSGFAAVAGIIVLIIAANQRERAHRLAERMMRFLPTRFDRAAWLRRLDDLLLGLKSLSSLRDGLILIGLSIVVWIPILVAYYFTMRAVGLQPTFVMTGFVVCAAAFSVAVPSTPGQVGPFHFAVITALQLYGQPAAEAASFAFLYHILNIVVLTLFGLIGVARTGVTFRHLWESIQGFTARRQAGETP